MSTGKTLLSFNQTYFIDPCIHDDDDDDDDDDFH